MGRILVAPSSIRLLSAAGFRIDSFSRAFSVASVALLVFLMLIRASVHQIASFELILSLYLLYSR